MDPDDSITADSKNFLQNFTASLDASWKDFRIGVADREWFWSILPGFVGDQADMDDERKVKKKLNCSLFGEENLTNKTLQMFSLGLEAVAEMERRGATIVPDAKIQSAPLSLHHVSKLMGKIMRD